MKEIRGAKADILAGYLSLLSKSTFIHVIRDGSCVSEHGIETMKSRGAISTESGLALLKDKIASMKTHIEMAEKFVAELEEA